MENEYMTQIWGIVALKENQHLTPKEMQEMILEQLRFFKYEVEDSVKEKLKRDYIKTIKETIEKL